MAAPDGPRAIRELMTQNDGRRVDALLEAPDPKNFDDGPFRPTLLRAHGEISVDP